jgi:hypothetical protein
VTTTAPPRLSDRELTNIDPYGGGFDGPFKVWTKVVRTRREQTCWYSADEHRMPAGTRAVRWISVHQGRWRRHYGCVACIEAEQARWVPLLGPGGLWS